MNPRRSWGWSGAATPDNPRRRNAGQLRGAATPGNSAARGCAGSGPLWARCRERRTKREALAARRRNGTSRSHGRPSPPTSHFDVGPFARRIDKRSSPKAKGRCQSTRSRVARRKAKDRERGSRQPGVAAGALCGSRGALRGSGVRQRARRCPGLPGESPRRIPTADRDAFAFAFAVAVARAPTPIARAVSRGETCRTVTL
jgi:hypothetical protein